MHSTPILNYLKKHGQKLDSEIAAAIGVPLQEVHSSLSSLAQRGEISHCKVTRFDNGKPIEGMIYRPLGYIPSASPGRKPGNK